MARTRKSSKQTDKTHGSNNWTTKQNSGTHRKQQKRKRTRNLKDKQNLERSPKPQSKQRTTRQVYKRKRSNSVELVAEIPCCASEKDRIKYSRLNLNTALFLTNSLPAKRKQSHISVITVPSSDDEISMDCTAKDIETMEVDNSSSPCDKEHFLRDTSTSNGVSKVSQVQDIKERMSLVSNPESPNTSFQPVYVSTPEAIEIPKHASHVQEENLSKGVGCSRSNPQSFLTNPLNMSIISLPSTSKSKKSPYTLLSSENSRQNKFDLTIGSSQRFYFGPSQDPTDVGINSLASVCQQTSQGSNSDLVVSNDSMVQETFQYPSGFSRLSLTDGSKLQMSTSLMQIPSTSQSPEFISICENVTEDSLQDEGSSPE